MSRQLYGIATDSPMGIGEICACSAYQVTEDGWRMKINDKWYDTYGIFYIDDDKQIIYYDEAEEYEGYERPI